MSNLQKIEISKLKGACAYTPVEIQFEQKKNITLIYGENGTGKTTIVDAFDVICNEKIGSINDISVGRKEKYLPSINANEKDLCVKLYFNNQVWNACIGAGKKPVIAGPKDRPSAQILRRNSLLNFIISQPKEKYEQLKEFISVPNCDSMETNLRNLEKQQKTSYNTAISLLTQSSDRLKTDWKAEEGENKTDKDEFAWAQRISNLDTVDLQQKVTLLESLKKKIDNCNNQKNRVVSENSNYNQFNTELEEINIQYEKAKENLIQNADSLISVLESSKNYISLEENLTECPVCKNKIERKKVLSDINTRLDNYKNLKTLRSNKNTYERKVQTSKSQLEKEFNNFKKSIDELINELIKYDSKIDFSIQIPDFSIDNIDTIVSAYEAAIKSLNIINEEYSKNQKNLTLINSVKTSLNTYQENKEESEQLEKNLKKIEAVIKVVEAERKKFIDDILNQISKSVDELYQQLHPDEGIGGVIWSLDPQKRNSIEFKGKFIDKADIPPQAYYSEAHLDTLGICIFIALAKHFGDKNTILILDDVLTSVDQSHVSRFMIVINELSKDFDKIILTTHYRPWRDRFKYAHEASGHIQFIELLPWSLEHGIRHTKTKMCVDELKDSLMKIPIDRQVIASKAGILLENLFDFLTIKYQLRLPRKQEYVLGDYERALDKKKKKHLKVSNTTDTGTIEIQIENEIDKIFELAWIRNQVGCHFNVSGQEIADSDVIDFGNKTVTFAEILICNECGELPNKNKSGSYWECKCAKKQLHPFQMPN